MYKSFTSKLDERKKRFLKINGYENIKNTINLLIEIMEDRKYYTHRFSVPFSANVKLHNNKHYATVEDTNIIITNILKKQYNLKKDFKKVIGYMNISESAINTYWEDWIDRSRDYIRDMFKGYCTDDEKEKAVLSSCKNVGFCGRSGGYICFESEYDFSEELEDILYRIEENEIQEYYSYSDCQNIVKTAFTYIVGYDIILDDIQDMVENSSFHDELEYHFENEISENEEIQKIIIEECKQNEFEFIGEKN